MARSKSMGIGAMFVLLVLAVVVLPIIVRYIGDLETTHFLAQGFQDIAANNNVSSTEGGVSGVPAIGSASKLPKWRPDPNTNYLCNSPGEDGQPCPEGQFCDGTTQSCIPNYVGGEVPTTGYFS